MPFLQVSTDNTADSSLRFFSSGQHAYGLPSRIRTDKGGEYTSVRAVMEELLGHNRGSALQGRSVHNVRIERFWRDVGVKVIDKYYELFCYMTDHRILDVDSPIHMFVLHFVFLPRIRRDLESLRIAHNNHRIRTENYQTPLQMWSASAISNVNSHLTAIDNLFFRDAHIPIPANNSNPDDIDESQVGQNIVIIPSVPNPLSYEAFLGLQSQFDPLADSNFHGIDVYGNVLSFVLDHVNKDIEESDH